MGCALEGRSSAGSSPTSTNLVPCPDRLKSGENDLEDSGVRADLQKECRRRQLAIVLERKLSVRKTGLLKEYGLRVYAYAYRRRHAIESAKRRLAIEALKKEQEVVRAFLSGNDH